MIKTNIKIPLLESQNKFLNSTKKEVLFSGAWRAGKSRALCYAMVKQVIKNPLNTVLLCRKTLQSLKKSTLITLLRGDDANPVLPPGSYTHHMADQYIQLLGGGRINYSGIDDPVKIRSMSLGAVGVDEALEFNLDEYLELMGRLSLNSGTRQIYSATNPGVPGHFLYKRFFKEDSPKREVVIAKTIDNPYLPKDYLESLKDMPEDLYKRYALGEWLLLDNAVYNNYSRDKHSKRLDLRQLYDEYFIGVDMGFTDPAVFLLVGRLGDRFYILSEYYKTKSIESQLVTVLKDIVNTLKNPYTIVVDPSQPSFIQTLQYHGLNTVKANNDILGGIARVRQRFEIRNDSPDLLIDSNCTNLMNELESYQYKEGTENPVDKFNHGPDALRYVFNYYCDNKRAVSSNFIIDLDKQETNDLEEILY